jgi:hypothetical protein
MPRCYYDRHGRYPGYSTRWPWHTGRRRFGYLARRPRDAERIIVVVAARMRAGLGAAQGDDNAVSGQTVLRTAAYSRVTHLP